MSSRLTLAAAVLLTLGPVRAARAFEVKHSADGALVRWFREDIEWTIDRSIRDVEGGDEAIRAATSAWSGQHGAPTLSYGPESAALEPGFDRKNTVSYVASGFEPAGSALAVTLLTFDDRTGEVLDADIVFNGKYRFANLAENSTAGGERPAPARGTYDIGRIAAHEMGHALGLSDEFALPNVLMYPFVPKSRVLPSSPAADDLAGLRALYVGEHSVDEVADEVGPDESSHPGCAVAPCARGSSASPLAVAWLLLCALALTRAHPPRRTHHHAAAMALVFAAAWVSVTTDAVALSNEPGSRITPGTEALKDRGARVTRVESTSIRGIFRSEVEVVTSHDGTTPSVTHGTVWGGSVGGIRQVIGGVHVPEEGELLTAAAVRRLHLNVEVDAESDSRAAMTEAAE